MPVSRLLILCALLLPAVACNDKDNGGGDEDSGNTAPSVTVTAPLEGSTVTLPFAFGYDVTGLTLEPSELGGANVDGHGHAHIYVDGKYVDATGESSYTVADLDPGTHTLEVRLSENDHTEIPGASDSVSVTVEASGEPLIAITSPTFGDDFDFSSIQMNISVLNFTLSDAVGGTNVEGEGHYHIFVDNTYYDYSYETQDVWVTRLSPGDHEIGVELVQNNHESLDTPVTDTTSVTINEGAPFVQLTSPTFSSSINSSSFDVAVDVADFILDPDNFGGTNVDGYGHYHVYVDGVYTTASADPSTWLYRQAPGEHIIGVVLADNDHTELGSYDYARVYLPDTRPYVEITTPAAGDTVPSDFNVSVATENYVLSSDVEGTDVEGEGHFHVYVDGIYYSYSYDASTPLVGIDPGEHTLTVELVTNNHASLEEVVIDQISITVE